MPPVVRNKTELLCTSTPGRRKPQQETRSITKRKVLLVEISMVYQINIDRTWIGGSG